MAITGPIWVRAEKNENLSLSIRRLFAYAGRYRNWILVASCVTFVLSVMSLIGPQFLSQMADEISAAIEGSRPVDMDLIAKCGIVLAVLYTTVVAGNVICDYVMANASERVANMMRKDITRKLDRLPLSYVDSRSTGDLMSRMTTDCDNVGKFYGDSLSMTISGLISVFGSFVMMLITEWHLALLSCIPAVTGFVLVYTITRRTQRFFRAQQRDLGAINGLVEEAYYGHDVMRMYNAEGKVAEQFEELNGRIYKSSFKARAITSMVPQAMNFIGNLGYVVVCIAGSIMIINGSIGYGVVVAFIVYVRMFSHPMAMLSESISLMQSVASSSDRVLELLDAEEVPSEEESEPLTDVRGDVEFRDVHFGYEEGREVIHGLDLKITAGSRVAIVGHTGSGKTTLANLLMRFYDVDSGDILVDGRSIYSMTRYQARSMFSMVLQDTWLMDGTVRENVAFAGDIPDEEIMAACEAVGLGDYVASLKDGLDSHISSDGDGLSAGQRQQITIARALVRDAPMIILDEATSNIDTRTEKRIQAAMDVLTEGRTSFVIAHRLSTIMNSDIILVMKDGEVAEKGTHGELISAGGYYKSLYDSQFEDCD